MGSAAGGNHNSRGINHHEIQAGSAFIARLSAAWPILPTESAQEFCLRGRPRARRLMPLARSQESSFPQEGLQPSVKEMKRRWLMEGVAGGHINPVEPADDDRCEPRSPQASGRALHESWLEAFRLRRLNSWAGSALLQARLKRRSLGTERKR
jgi:hypothetical protein